MECETILESVAAPADVLGLDSIVGLTPPPEEYQDEQMIAYSAGQVRIINQSQLSIHYINQSEVSINYIDHRMLWRQSWFILMNN